MAEKLHPELQRCYDIALRGAYRNPFFLIPLGHLEWHEVKEQDRGKVPTMCVTSRITGTGSNKSPELNLYINPDFSATLPDDEIFGCLAHEIMHTILRHHERAGGKKEEFWAQATDMAINEALIQSQIKLPRACLRAPRGHEESAAEEIYSVIYTEEEDQPPPKNYDPGKVGQGCMPAKQDPTGDNQGQDPSQDQNPSGGSGSGQDNQDPQSGAGKSEQDSQSDERVWGEMQAQCANAAAGSGMAPVVARLFARKPSKTTWKRLIRALASKSASTGGRDIQTFQRPNRRSGEIIFPGWKSSKPALAIVIDSSGSVSDSQLEASINSAIDLAKLGTVRVYLVLHTGGVYFEGWVAQGITAGKLAAMCTDRGGTDAHPAFKAVAAVGGHFDYLIYLTDGEMYNGYPERPSNVRKVFLGIVSDSKYRTPCPDSWREVLVDIDGAKESE